MSTALARLVLASLVALATSPALAQDHGGHGHGEGHRHGDHAGGHDRHGPHDATVRHRFDDVERWVKIFDDPERDAWQKPTELVDALGLDFGDCVADIGAGTGYFELALSEAVGDEGAVLAVDVEPGLVEHMRKRAEQEGTPNVVPILGSFDNPRLPPRRVDLILIVNTFHHFDDRLAYMQRLRDSLTRKGSIVIVDFQKRELPVGPPLEHKLSRGAVVKEMAQAGYRLSKGLDKLLPHQYVLVFKPRR